MNPYDEVWMAEGTLTKFPKIASALGEVVAAWSYAESVVVRLLACILRDVQIAEAIYYSTPTFDGRVRMIKSVINATSLQEAHKEAALKAIEGLRGLSGTRNSYIHNRIIHNQQGTEAHMIAPAQPPGSPARGKPMKAADIMAHADAVIKRAHQVLEALMQAFPQARFVSPADVPSLAHPKTGPILPSRT